MFSRNARISEVLLHELSRLVRSVKDPGLCGILTLTGLDLSPDRKKARVFFSILGSAEERESSAKALNRAAPFLRRGLRPVMDLRSVPELEFQYDHTPEKADRIERILGKLEAERGEPPRDKA